MVGETGRKLCCCIPVIPNKNYHYPALNHLIEAKSVFKNLSLFKIADKRR